MMSCDSSTIILYRGCQSLFLLGPKMRCQNGLQCCTCAEIHYCADDTSQPYAQLAAVMSHKVCVTHTMMPSVVLMLCRYCTTAYVVVWPLAPVRLFTTSCCSIVWRCKNHLWRQEILTGAIFCAVTPDRHPCCMGTQQQSCDCHMMSTYCMQPSRAYCVVPHVDVQVVMERVI